MTTDLSYITRMAEKLAADTARTDCLLIVARASEAVPEGEATTHAVLGRIVGEIVEACRR